MPMLGSKLFLKTYRKALTVPDTNASPVGQQDTTGAVGIVVQF